MKNAVIFMQSRTGSSMIAGVFRAHGWATGGDDVRSRNYVTHENQRIKTYLKRAYGTRRTPVMAAEPDTRLQAIIESEFGDRPWCWKGDLFYASLWSASFPDLAAVYVKRDIPDAVRSGLVGRTFPLRRGDGRVVDYETAASELEDFLKLKFALMDELCLAGLPGRIVDASAVMRGELDTLREAVEYAGGTWDEGAARSVIRIR